MTSTGNDIVALAAINVDRTKQPNFYSKIITDTEESFYDEALSAVLPLEHFVWLAWSVKESVYKFLQREQHDLVFSPSKINLEQLSRDDVREIFSGIIRFGNYKLYSRSVVTEEYIFSVVNDLDNFNNIHWQIRKIGSAEPEGQSAEVRKLLLAKLSDLFPGDHFAIEKNLNGYPVILKNHSETDVVVSFTHHDHYVAYSFIQPG